MPTTLKPTLLLLLMVVVVVVVVIVVVVVVVLLVIRWKVEYEGQAGPCRRWLILLFLF